MSHPMAVAVDGNGQIYTSNNSLHMVEVIRPGKREPDSFGGQGSLPGQMMYPYGIGILPEGGVLVAETGNRRIQQFAADGEFIQTFTGAGGKTGLNKPGPVHVDSKGNVYVGDIGGAQVLVFDKKATLLRTIKNVSYPHGIAVDEQNRKIYVSDAGQAIVRVFALDDREGRQVDVIRSFAPGMSFGMVRGLAVDKLGRLYVVDSLAGTVRVFDKDGAFLFSFGEQGFGDGEMLYPTQIFIDNSGKIFIADWGNNRIQVWGY